MKIMTQYLLNYLLMTVNFLIGLFLPMESFKRDSWHIPKLPIALRLLSVMEYIVKCIYAMVFQSSKMRLVTKSQKEIKP